MKRFKSMSDNSEKAQVLVYFQKEKLYSVLPMKSPHWPSDMTLDQKLCLQRKQKIYLKGGIEAIVMSKGGTNKYDLHVM